ALHLAGPLPVTQRVVMDLTGYDDGAVRKGLSTLLTLGLVVCSGDRHRTAWQLAPAAAARPPPLGALLASPQKGEFGGGKEKEKEKEREEERNESGSDTSSILESEAGKAGIGEGARVVAPVVVRPPAARGWPAEAEEPAGPMAQRRAQLYATFEAANVYL